MNIFYPLISAALLLGLTTSHAATLILDGTKSFTEKHPFSVHQTQLDRAITKAKTAIHTTAVDVRNGKTSGVVLMQAYNFNFVDWYLKDEISLEDLLSLARALTSLQPSATNKQTADSVWKTPLVTYNLSFCNALLELLN